MYPLIETICVLDGAIQNLEWHQERYEYSFNELYGLKPTDSVIEGFKLLEKYSSGCYKLRVSYSDRNKKYELEKYSSRQINTLKLVRANSLDYELKYADREPLNQLVQHKADCDDILILKNEKVTDASYANIVFTDGEKWFTPSTPLLKGTCRARLLKEKKIIAIDIGLHDLSKYLGFNLINAMNDLNTSSYVKIENIIQ
ncbi:aminotransferase class IV [Aurantibacter crassamenti]|uniref:aminotransferase class IV n=1 Tax=Aurantibacter crassamenti TaxID=1837375 RepID=UPI001939B1F2|nr:aminotransferase class IV [Aurantibacter crassamenti]MBM1107628.1 aminotransferase class IV [Aurantibacter crassamenti]